ncbi:MAG: hypothetical protein NTY36_02225 [Deltaproteobacteria bacterium]|nr:hypothetical protein [Deltaproteobacteria bacterium]
MAEIHFTVKEPDFSNCYSERLDEIAKKALEPLTGFSKTLIALGKNADEIFADDIGETVKGLVNNAKAEIEGAIKILFDSMGVIGIRRASYNNESGLRPTAMVGKILICSKSAETYSEIDDFQPRAQAAPEGGGSMSPQDLPKETITLTDPLTDEFWRLDKLTIALITLLDTMEDGETEKEFLLPLLSHLKDLGCEIKAELAKAFRKLDRFVTPGDCWETLLQLTEKA